MENRAKETAGQNTKSPDTEVIAGIDTVGSLAAWAVSEAILRGVRSAASAFGYPAVSDLNCRLS